MNMQTFFIIVLVLGVMTEFYYLNKREVKRKEEIVHVYVIATLILSLLLCFLLKGHASPTSSNLAKTLGSYFLVHGLFIRFWTYQIIMAQSKQFILPFPERPIFSHGPYRYHRHPFHTSLFVITLGFGLFISNHWLAFPVIFILLGSSLHPVMKQEERYLEKKYGQIYTYWCKHRFRLLPFFY